MRDGHKFLHVISASISRGLHTKEYRLTHINLPTKYASTRVNQSWREKCARGSSAWLIAALDPREAPFPDDKPTSKYYRKNVNRKITITDMSWPEKCNNEIQCVAYNSSGPPWCICFCTWNFQHHFHERTESQTSNISRPWWAHGPNSTNRICSVRLMEPNVVTTYHLKRRSASTRTKDVV